MKKFLIFLFLFFFLYAPGSYAQNLLSNPGFEKGGESWVLKTAKIDRNIRHSGKSSLKYTNTDPKRYQVILSHINVKGGETLDFSAWVKGNNVKPQSNYAKKGAGMYIHAYDANNKSLGGSNPPTIAGNFDWTKVEGRYVVPKNAKRLAVSLYLVQGNTGTVWFDDVYVGHYKAPQATASSKAAVQKGKVYIDSKGFTVQNGKRIFPFGIYIAKGGKQAIWANADTHLRRIKSAGFNTILSYYYGDHPDAQKYLDLTNSIGLNVIYNLSDMYDGHANYADQQVRPAEKINVLVKQLKNKPSLLSWYSADEITSSHIPAAEHNYQLIKSLDPDHPVFQVNNQLNLIPSLLNAADIVGTDPYPIGTSKSADLNIVGNWTAKTIAQAGKQKGVWQVIQVFNKGAYQSTNLRSYQDPSEAQIRNMLFQSVIEGAKGILFYSYHDLWHSVNAQDKKDISEEVFQQRWKLVSKIAGEFSRIIPIILADEVVEVPKQIKSANIKAKAWKYQGKIYVMSVNKLTNEASFSAVD